jgi:hypothetical protein
MRRFSVCMAVLLAVYGVTPSSATAAEAACREPAGTYRYTKTGMVYELALDLTGCDWWTGTSIVLDGFLVRQHPAGVGVTTLGLEGTETTGFAICEDPLGATSCVLSIGLAHPPAEIMTYRGRIRYPWKNGRWARDLEVTCLSAGEVAECRASGPAGVGWPNASAPLVGVRPEA